MLKELKIPYKKNIYIHNYNTRWYITYNQRMAQITRSRFSRMGRISKGRNEGMNNIPQITALTKAWRKKNIK